MEKEVNKLRGGYYTPDAIARFIAEWAITENDVSILEPSCGDGSLIKSSRDRLIQLGVKEQEIFRKVTGIELFEKEAKKAQSYGANIVCSDFFSFYKNNIDQKRRFDVVIGNPPFIRYQNFNEEYRKIAFELTQKAGVELNRLTNIWIPFLILSTECLSENGKLGMVIPAELFQVDYAADTRMYLSDHFDHLTVITFRKLLFDGAQQEVILLLGEKRSEVKGIEVYELKDASELSSFTQKKKSEIKNLAKTHDKWVRYYLSNSEIDLLNKVEMLPSVIRTTDLFETNVGVVSGQNKFFVIDRTTVEQWSLEKAVSPIIGRSEQLKGIVLTEDDFKDLVNKRKKVHLFTPEDVELNQLTANEQEYIHNGEKQGFHEGYKCRIRKRWYIVPQSWKPDAFLLRQINRYPKLVLNQVDATNTDTLHKVRFLPNVEGDKVSAAFINSFTFAQCEVTGRSYGGGVLTFEPGEIRRIAIPMGHYEKLDVNIVDSFIREGEIIKALDYVDQIVLEEGAGLTREDVERLRGIWQKLSDRRMGRREDFKE